MDLNFVMESGFDHFIVQTKDGSKLVQYSNLSSKETVVGKVVLTYRDGEMKPIIKEYPPFRFGKTYKIKDAYDNRFYFYRIINFLSGEFAFNSPDNKRFPTLNSALSMLDRYAKAEKEDREYFLLKK